MSNKILRHSLHHKFLMVIFCLLFDPPTPFLTFFFLLEIGKMVVGIVKTQNTCFPDAALPPVQPLVHQLQ